MKTLNMKSVAFLSIEIIWYFAAHPVQAVLWRVYMCNIA